MHSILLLWLAASMTTVTFAQQRQLTGSLRTKEGEAVAYASVALISNDRQVLAFASSNSQGDFTIILPDGLEKKAALFLSINHLGYKKIHLPFQIAKGHYDLLMEEQAIDLQEVEVKSRPKIVQSGDTLSYNVGSFAKTEDRSIADVLRRMPGIELEDNGQIKYNGKAISNFYIDGDDLLNDGYAIGSKTIPYDMVQDVEVLQNHQPIKALQDKNLSENVALNLKIKEEAKLKWTGQAKIGLGLPAQYDGELNGMLFNKKYKMLNLIKANNVGTDLQDDFKAFNEENRRSAMDDNRPSSMLSFGTASALNLPKNRYYFNQSAELNANNLVNLKNGLQLKANVGLWLDDSRIDYNSTNAFYLDRDTIHYQENQYIQTEPYQIHLALQAKTNKDKYYFSNTLEVDLSASTQGSFLQTNQRDITQRLQITARDFSNSLAYIPHTLKNILRFNWDVYHYQNPQSLQIYPGVESEIFHDSLSYLSTQQLIETPVWFSNFSFGYSLPKGSIKQHYRLGTLNEWQQMNSSLLLMGKDSAYHSAEHVEDNHLSWQRHRLMASAIYEWKNNRWEAQLSLPLAWQHIYYRDPGFALEEQRNKWLFTPSWRVKYFTTEEDYLELQYAANQHMGNLSDVYAGTILNNYRNLTSNASGLQEQSTHSGGLQYNFQRNISMLFINAGINYSRMVSSTIAARTVENNSSHTEWLPFRNVSNNLSFNGGISKYLFDLDATTGLNLSWNRSYFNQLMNGLLLPYQNISYTLNPNLKVRLWDRIEVNYDAKATWLRSSLTSKEQADIPRQQIQTLDQSISLSFIPFLHSFIRINGRHLYSNQAPMENVNYFFTDASFRYQLNKQQIDLQFDITNIANIQQYETYSLSANQFGFQRYSLLGRMALLKVHFNF